MGRELSVRNVVGVVSVGLLISFAVIVGYRPALLPPAVATPIEVLTSVLPTRLTIIGVGVVVGLIGVLGSWVWRTRNRTTALSDHSAEVPDHDVAVAGECLTQQFEHKHNGRYISHDESVEDELRVVLLSVYRQQFDDRKRARSYVDDGSWTDDQVAAATLTATKSVDFPPLYRLYAWLYPEHAYAYRIRRSLRAVEDTCSEQLSTYTPTERPTSRKDRLRSLLSSATDGDRQ